MESGKTKVVWALKLTVLVGLISFGLGVLESRAADESGASLVLSDRLLSRLESVQFELLRHQHIFAALSGRDQDQALESLRQELLELRKVLATSSRSPSSDSSAWERFESALKRTEASFQGIVPVGLQQLRADFEAAPIKSQPKSAIADGSGPLSRRLNRVQANRNASAHPGSGSLRRTSTRRKWKSAVAPIQTSV